MTKHTPGPCEIDASSYRTSGDGLCMLRADDAMRRSNDLVRPEIVNNTADVRNLLGHIISVHLDLIIVRNGIVSVPLTANVLEIERQHRECVTHLKNVMHQIRDWNLKYRNRIENPYRRFEFPLFIRVEIASMCQSIKSFIASGRGQRSATFYRSKYIRGESQVGFSFSFATIRGVKTRQPYGDTDCSYCADSLHIGRKSRVRLNPANDRFHA